MPGFFIGRQPIFTPRLKVFGYELRGQLAGPGAVLPLENENELAQSILKTYADIGLDTLVYDQWAFIHFSPDYLVRELPLLFSPTRLILETKSAQVHDEALEQVLVDLEATGFQVLVEDVTSFEMVERLVRTGRIIKIDVTDMVRPEIAWIATRFKKYEVRLLASGVKSMDDFEFCHRLGFSLFQGRFIYQPDLLKSGKIDSSRVTVLQALAVSADENSDFVQLEKIIAQDVAMTDRLLRLVNSVYYSTTDTVKSLQQAIAMVGREQLRRWITLILMSTVQEKPLEITSTAVIRAKMCELLARSMGRENVEEFFLCGLLSIVDALMDLPMEQVIAQLSLSPELVDGLLHQKGLTGMALSIVQDYENGEWEKLNNCGINPETISDAYINSIRWSAAIVNSMKE